MEQIYTIIINESFERCAKEDASCPFCAIRGKFDDDEISLILGASMMEPSVRIKTNELGFCKDHFKKMLRAGKKLPVALLLESHFAEVTNKMKIGGILPLKSAKGSASSVGKLSETCYVCDRIGTNFGKVLDNTVYMWATDADFRRLFAEQKCFCLPHYAAVMKCASEKMRSPEFRSFSSALYAVVEKYVSKTREDLSAFIKSFDYRYSAEPSDAPKDAVEKSVKALIGSFEP